MWTRKKHSPLKRIDSLIGAGTVVRGDVTFTGGLRIDGQVHGNVIAVSYRTLEMHVGAVIQGRLCHGEPGSASVVELKRVGGD